MNELRQRTAYTATGLLGNVVVVVGLLTALLRTSCPARPPVVYSTSPSKYRLLLRDPVLFFLRLLFRGTDDGGGPSPALRVVTLFIG